MKTIFSPSKLTWQELTLRPSFETKSLTESVENIMEEVRTKGDEALRKLTADLDKVDLTDLRVSRKDLGIASSQLTVELKNAIELAFSNIFSFHEAQKRDKVTVEIMNGIRCWQENTPIQRVGLYVPGGSAPLFSSLLMLGIPAMLAGCKEVVVCTPPSVDGNVDPTIRYVASLLQLSKVYKVGGAQAIAAMTFGTASIPKVDKIFGPGNQYVTKAKELAQHFSTAIDMPAGPSEVLIIADVKATPAFVAADLLSQAEHGPDSQVVLLSTSSSLVDQVQIEIQKQLEKLPRQSIIKNALQNSLCIVFDSLDTCMEFSNQYAPEHLIINTSRNNELINQVENAGSVFVGDYSCESAGDYASGTNHTLPTNGFAASYSGVNLDSFMKKITFQELSQKGLRTIGKAIELMAEAEGLEAHKQAVSLRLKKEL